MSQQLAFSAAASLPEAGDPRARFASAFYDGRALRQLRNELDASVDAAAEDRTAPGLVELVRVCLLRSKLDDFVCSLPDEALQCLAVTGQVEEALAYADMNGPQCDTMGSVAAALHRHGDKDKAAAIVESIVKRWGEEERRAGEVVCALAAVGRESEAQDRAQVWLGELERSGTSSRTWAEAARILAEAGLRDEALQAARRAAGAIPGELVDGHKAAISWSLDFESLLDQTADLLPEVMGRERLEALVAKAARLESRGYDPRIPKIYCRLAGLFARLGERDRAAEVLSAARASVERESIVEWILEGQLEALVDAAVEIGDQELIPSLLEGLRSHAAYPDGATGAGIVHCGAGLLRLGLDDLGIEAVREGAGYVAADGFFLDFLSAGTLAKAAGLIAATRVPGALEEALELARATPLVDQAGECWRKAALADILSMLMRTGQMETARAVAAETMRAAWEFASLIPERSLLSDAAALLGQRGAAGAAVAMAQKALAVSDDGDDYVFHLADEAVLYRLVGDETEALLAAREAAAVCDRRPKEGGFLSYEISRAARRCRRLCEGGDRETAEKLARWTLDRARSRAMEEAVSAGERLSSYQWTEVMEALEAVGDVAGQRLAVETASAAKPAEGDQRRAEEVEILWARLGEAAAEHGDAATFDDAMAKIGDLDEADYRSAEVAIRLARGSLALGRTTQAEAALARAVLFFKKQERCPGRTVIMLVDTLVSAGMVGEAARVATYHGLGPGSSANLAPILARAGLRDRALANLRRGVLGASSDYDLLDVTKEAIETLAEWDEVDLVVALVDAVLEVAHVRPATKERADSLGVGLSYIAPAVD